MYQIIGHRGDRANYPENTLASFKSALETDGVNGIELDVIVSKDKKLIISHDTFLKDNENKKHYIHELTHIELLALAETYDGMLPEKLMRYPTLEDVFNLYKSQFKKKHIIIEIKSLPTLDSLPLPFPELISEIHLLIKKFSMQNYCYIISFDFRIIQESYKQNPEIKIGLILHRNLLPLSCIIDKLKLSAFIMEKDWITNQQAKELSQKNIDIFSWSPNTEKDWLRLEKLGVKAIITDKPRMLSLFRAQNSNEF